MKLHNINNVIIYIIIKSRKKIIINYVSDKKKRWTFTFFLNVFNIRLNTRKKHDVYINPPVFNIRLIKILCVLFYTNNKINMFDYFVIIIRELEKTERRRLNIGFLRTLKKND